MLQRDKEGNYEDTTMSRQKNDNIFIVEIEDGKVDIILNGCKKTKKKHNKHCLFKMKIILY